MPLAQLRSSLPFQVQDCCRSPSTTRSSTSARRVTYAGQHGRDGPRPARRRHARHRARERRGGRGGRPAARRWSTSTPSPSPASWPAATLRSADGRASSTSAPASPPSSIVAQRRAAPRPHAAHRAARTSPTPSPARSSIPVAEAEAAQARRSAIGFAVGPELAEAGEAIARSRRTLIEAIRNTFVYYSSNNPGARHRRRRAHRWRLAPARSRAVPVQREPPPGHARRPALHAARRRAAGPASEPSPASSTLMALPLGPRVRSRSMTSLLERPARRKRRLRRRCAVGLPQVNLLPPEVRAARALVQHQAWLAHRARRRPRRCRARLRVRAARSRGRERARATRRPRPSRLSTEAGQVRRGAAGARPASTTHEGCASSSGMSTEILWKAYLDAITAVLPADVSIDSFRSRGDADGARGRRAGPAARHRRRRRSPSPPQRRPCPTPPRWLDALDGVPGFADARVSTRRSTAEDGTAASTTRSRRPCRSTRLRSSRRFSRRRGGADMAGRRAPTLDRRRRSSSRCSSSSRRGSSRSRRVDGRARRPTSRPSAAGPERPCCRRRSRTLKEQSLKLDEYKAELARPAAARSRRRPRSRTSTARSLPARSDALGDGHRRAGLAGQAVVPAAPPVARGAPTRPRRRDRDAEAPGRAGLPTARPSPGGHRRPPASPAFVAVPIDARRGRHLRERAGVPRRPPDGHRAALPGRRRSTGTGQSGRRGGAVAGRPPARRRRARRSPASSTCSSDADAAPPAPVDPAAAPPAAAGPARPQEPAGPDRA